MASICSADSILRVSTTMAQWVAVKASGPFSTRATDAAE